MGSTTTFLVVAVLCFVPFPFISFIAVAMALTSFWINFWIGVVRNIAALVYVFVMLGVAYAIASGGVVVALLAALVAIGLLPSEYQNRLAESGRQLIRLLTAPSAEHQPPQPPAQQFSRTPQPYRCG